MDFKFYGNLYFFGDNLKKSALKSNRHNNIEIKVIRVQQTVINAQQSRLKKT